MTSMLCLDRIIQTSGQASDQWPALLSSLSINPNE